MGRALFFPIPSCALRAVARVAAIASMRCERHALVFARMNERFSFVRDAANEGIASLRDNDA